MKFNISSKLTYATRYAPSGLARIALRCQTEKPYHPVYKFIQRIYACCYCWNICFRSVRPTNQFDEHASLRFCWHRILNKVQIFALVRRALVCKHLVCAPEPEPERSNMHPGGASRKKWIHYIPKFVLCCFRFSFFYVAQHNNNQHKTVMEIMFTCLSASALEHNRRTHSSASARMWMCAHGPERRLSSGKCYYTFVCPVVYANYFLVCLQARVEQTA